MTELAATFGGAGFIPRIEEHLDEMAHGRVWAPCGVDSEYQTLRTVLLAEPSGRERFRANPNDILFLELPDPTRLREQFFALKEAYASAGVEVLTLEADLERWPNLLFQRDLFAMTPQGAVLARPASVQRAGEEVVVASKLTSSRVPVVGMVVGIACMEGADLLWLRPGSALLGVGQRTNMSALMQLRNMFATWGYGITEVQLARGTQHLLGAFNRIDADLAVVDSESTAPLLRALLAQEGVEVLDFSPSSEVRARRATNFVTLGPRRVLMPAGCQITRLELERRGVHVTEVDVSEYVKAGGAMACASGIVMREALARAAYSEPSKRASDEA